MSEPASIATGIANRYATAVFDIAREENALDALERDVDALYSALGESADLRDLIRSPIYGRDESRAAIVAVARQMDLGATVTNVLGLMAQKRRLFVLPQLLAALRERLSAERGEVTADVISARALSEAQSDRLAEKVGKEVRINQTVDESLIGGLVVKVGSRMIDTSIRSKLASLQNHMKEAR